MTVSKECVWLLVGRVCVAVSKECVWLLVGSVCGC